MQTDVGSRQSVRKRARARDLLLLFANNHHGGAVNDEKDGIW